MASHPWKVAVVTATTAAFTIALASPASAHSTQQWANGVPATPGNIGAPAAGVRGGAIHSWALDERNDYFDPSPLGGRNEWCTLVADRLDGVFDFGHACAHHDYCYMFHRVTTGRPATRSDCDGRFLQDMNATCRQMHPNPWDPGQLAPRTTCLATAAGYYQGVVAGGQFYWDIAEDPDI